MYLMIWTCWFSYTSGLDRCSDRAHYVQYERNACTVSGTIPCRGFRRKHLKLLCFKWCDLFTSKRTCHLHSPQKLLPSNGIGNAVPTMMRCEKYSQLNSTNFSSFLDSVPHHPSFEAVERAALAGCALYRIFDWNTRLHQPHTGSYDVHLKKARAATGSVRLMRQVIGLLLNIGGEPANTTISFVCPADFHSETPSYHASSTLRNDLTLLMC